MSNPLPQLVADRYRLISPLGQGGMGRVWKARDEVLHRDVAIKELVPPPSLTPDERREMRERSLREARAIARLNHVNVVRIFDVLRTDGDPWIVMEYVPSKSLQDILAEDGPVSLAKAIDVGLGVLGALNAAHKAGVMHRDVKPGNVLIGDDGRVVLTDFGLATIPGDPNVTRTGMVLGSPAYIAPERARDGTAGPEADLWSLGATLYAAVEGKSPYARPSAIGTLAALATEPMPPPKNAGPLKAVLTGLLRKDPAERIDAAAAERLLRRAAGRRAKGISLLDGVRRPGPNGPREPRRTVVPAPRPAEQGTERTVTPPAPRTPGLAAAAAAGSVAAGASGGDATAKVPAGGDADPTARVDRTERSTDADPTARVTEPGPVVDQPATAVGEGGATADPTAKIADAAGTAADPTAALSEPTAKLAGPETAWGGGAPRGAVDDTRVEPAADAPVSPPRPPRERATSVLSAPVSPPPVSSGRAAVVAGAKPGHHRRSLLIGALVAVLLLGLLVVVPLLGNDDDPEKGGGPQAGATSAAPSAPVTSAPAPSPTSAAPSPTPSPTGLVLPDGWTLHKDPTGFSMPLPKGWRRSSGSTWVQFREPNGVREVTIDRTDTPKRDAAAAWRAMGDRNVNNYKNLGIRTVPGFWKTCADWEWLETRDNTRIHVRNRGFVTAKDRGYAIRWEVAASEWAANLDEFELIAKNFKPDRAD
ncbi:Serine/threonine-protein kinase PrkC [Micromonospora sp. MW-13]|uniref:serine/threonine-protein kinase n=1 Tax=Micromonospora sp. MW-13 TaxID=2094022 RepID=UPI000E4438D9|nr:serine/threonine-protein kinase [Micromonospora sp. MW-13]RGC66284.1 Serine/threonine-protein kinase PrkC [Micromonospora sp. MW-13]